MSDHIAHLGICDDTFRLANLHPEIQPLFKKWMKTYLEISHMGSVTRSADKWSVGLIVDLRVKLNSDEGQMDLLACQKMAFILGALTHRAADRLTKPITNCWRDGTPAGEESFQESKIMQDIFVFKEVYGSGCGVNHLPFRPDVLEVPIHETTIKMEEYFRVLLRRALISMHTIAPDPDNIHAWLDAFLSRLQTFPKSISRYAELATKWDSEKVEKYLINKHFYNREDKIIRLARDIQSGSCISEDQLLSALAEMDRSQSRYARALAKAIGYLIAATKLFNNKISREQAEIAFEIGVPELAIKD